jgi:hypothetical protein
MTQYRQIEYIIGKDGKITEKVINASGSDCTETTKQVETDLGEIESQELLPEYYQSPELLDTSETQYLSE